MFLSQSIPCSQRSTQSFMMNVQVVSVESARVSPHGNDLMLPSLSLKSCKGIYNNQKTTTRFIKINIS